MVDQSAGRVQHLVQLARTTVPPLHPAGRPIVLGAAAAALGSRQVLRLFGLRRAGRVAGSLGAVATAGSAAFFRSPHRVTPTYAPGLVVAPADGIVSLLEEASPPPELDIDPTPQTRVSIFLSIFDVHVQRIPTDGVVTRIAYRPGAFLSADLDKASADNERNSLLIEATVGGAVVVTQIAGLVARRIVSDAVRGAPVLAGATYGLIRFGSRVDTYLPPGSTVTVQVGQRTVGGETVLGTLPGEMSTGES